MAVPSATNNDKIPEQILENDDNHEFDEGENFLHSASAPASVTTPAAENMATEKKHASKNRRIEESSYFLQHMTTAAHACLLLFVILIVYFCFSTEFQFFTWHPLLLSTGWVFLMTEAILSLSKDNLLTGTLSKKIRVKLHWIFQTIALTFITIGFIVVYVNKNYLNKTHFKSWHALFGFIGIVAAILTCLNGILALYHGDLRHYIRPKINKFIHILSGIIAFSFGGLALVLSVYTKWFAKHSNNNVLTFALGLGFVLVAVICTMIRPIITCCRQLGHLM